MKASYNAGVGDEFIEPFRVAGVDGKMREGDIVICFNFRTDRCRQITAALTQENFPEDEMQTLQLHYVTMTNYDESFSGVKVIYDKPNLQSTLGETLVAAGRKQIQQKLKSIRT